MIPCADRHIGGFMAIRRRTGGDIGEAVAALT
jgi:hypothetical protein